VTDDINKIKEFIEADKELKDNYEPKGSGEKYQYDVIKCLTDKLKKYNVPHSDIAEIAAYLSYKAIVFAHDELRYYQNQSRIGVIKRYRNQKDGD
jgi:hypothetical protein